MAAPTASSTGRQGDARDPFEAFDTFESGSGKTGIYRLARLEELGLCRVADLPFSIRVLLESVLRQCDGKVITEEHVKHLAGWQLQPVGGSDIPFKPARILLQDFTGVPAIVDLAAMRSAMKRLDLATVEPSLAGPKRPHDRVALAKLKQSFAEALRVPIAQRGFELKEDEIARKVLIANGAAEPLHHGLVVIAAITSCTNTSNPTVMLAAGLLAKNAAEKGLKSKSHVKTSLAPGSRVVSDYLDRAGLTPPYSPSGGNVRFGRGPARPGQPREENPAETMLRDIEGTHYGHHTGRALFAAPVGGRPENIWRYHYYCGRWWYWTPQRRCAYFDGRRWMPYTRR